MSHEPEAMWGPYITWPCDNPRGWTTVGRTTPSGIKVALYHWSQQDSADLMATKLNEGMDYDLTVLFVQGRF